MPTTIDGTTGVTSNSVALSSSTGIGYTTGSGGAVTQLTSKSTSVTLNSPSGQITMNNAALAASTTVSFTFGNSFLAATDTMTFAKTFAVGTNAAYQIWADINPGACQVNVRNISGGSLSEAIVINFAIIKGASA